MIKTEALTKDYGTVVAVKDLNIHVEKGEIYGFLGPNGAGKTTTISMILGIVKPTSGTISIFGKKLQDAYFDIKRNIGIVSEHQHFYDEMTAYEYLSFFADLLRLEKKNERIDELLHTVKLYDRRNERLGGYSKGMRQKIGLCRALLNDPDLLILDEPVTGLDPHGVKEVRDIIYEENKKGRTIFISSHILSEIEKTCNRIAILNKGRLVAEDTMDNLRKKLSKDVEIVIELEQVEQDLLDNLKELPFILRVGSDKNVLTLAVSPDKDYRKDISRFISSNGGVVIAMKQKEMSLEDAFVTITEHNISLLTEERDAS